MCNYMLCWTSEKRVQLKTDLASKMWLRSNAWKLLCQILYACLAGFCPLMCYFCLKLLYIYKIGITPNFKFEFCNCTSLFLCDVTFRKIIAKFSENCKLSSVKLILVLMCVDGQGSTKLAVHIQINFQFFPTNLALIVRNIFRNIMWQN